MWSRRLTRKRHPETGSACSPGLRRTAPSTLHLSQRPVGVHIVKLLRAGGKATVLVKVGTFNLNNLALPLQLPGGDPGFSVGSGPGRIDVEGPDPNEK
jgi:hypothetical protein